jgi:hypothetical protein
VLLEVAPREAELGFVSTRLVSGDERETVVVVPRVKTRSHRIVDAETGAPLTNPYALVSFSNYPARTVDLELVRRRVEADEHGVIRFPVQEDFYGHIVSAPGYEVSSLDRDVVPLQRSMRIDGQVLDSEGRPVADAAILISTDQGPTARCDAGLPMVAAWSDAEGRFDLEVKILWAKAGAPDPGVRSILALGPERGCAIVDSIPVQPGKRVGLTLRFPRPATLTIEVVGPNGEPRPDMWINVLRRIPVAPSWEKLQRFFGVSPTWLRGANPRTDASGRAVHEGLPPGDYDIQVQFDKHELKLEEGEQRTLRVVRGAGPSIKGQVFEADGEPADGRMVGLTGPTTRMATTDKEGRFVFEDVKPGTHKVGFHSRAANSWIRTDASAGDEVVLREPKELASLRIVVEGPEDGRAEYAYATASGASFPPSTGFWPITGGVEESQTFLPGVGLLVVRAKGHAWTIVRFEAHAGNPTEVRVRMPKAGQLKGSVSADFAGKRVYVWLYRADGYPETLAGKDKNLRTAWERSLGSPHFSAKVEEGKFDMPEVAPGDYRARLMRWDGTVWAELAAEIVEVRPGETSGVAFGIPR